VKLPRVLMVPDNFMHWLQTYRKLRLKCNLRAIFLDSFVINCFRKKHEGSTCLAI